jgi:hypothetical protein
MMTWGHIHDCQNNIEGSHFVDCSFPIFDFDGVLPVSQDDNFPRPCLFVSQVHVLSLDAYYEGVDCYITPKDVNSGE